MLINARNPQDAIEEISALSQTVASGGTSFTVLNTEGLVANDYILIGNLGEEQAELLQISSLASGNNVNLVVGTSHEHGPGTVVQKILYNQVEISYKTSLSGSWSVLTTIDIEPDDFFTTYNHSAGVESNYYRVRFYNSTTAVNTSYSAILYAGKQATDQLAPMVDFVLEQTNDREARFTSREQVVKYLEFAKQDVINSLIQASGEYFTKTIDIPTEDYKHEYTLPDDFREIDEIRNGDGKIVNPSPRNVIDQFAQGYEIVNGKLYLNDVPEPASTSTTPITILSNNAYDEEGTWVASGDANGVTTDLDEFKTGNGSVNFDITASGIVAIMTNATVTSTDLSTYEDSGKWRVWVYLPDVTYITNVTMHWGSDASNYWSLTESKDYKNESLTDGWNLLEFDWSDSAVTEVLTPDSAAIDYIQLRFNYSASQPDDEDFRIDAIQIANSYGTNSVYEMKYFYQPDMMTSEMDTTGLPPGNTALLCDYAIARIEYRKTQREAVARRFENSYFEQKKRFITQSAKRTRRMIGMRPYGRKRRYSTRNGGNFVSSDDDFIVRKI